VGIGRSVQVTTCPPSGPRVGSAAPYRRPHASALVVLAGSAAVGLTLLTTSSAEAAPRPGQFCAPKGGAYRTATATLLCAPGLLGAKKDESYRWRNITGPAGPRGPRGATAAPGPAGPTGPSCPSGYTQQPIQIQAIATGTTAPTWLTVLACVAATPTPTATATP
jgi:hypothetical protein